MEALTNTSSTAYLTPKASNFAIKISSFLRNQNPYMKFANGYFPISLSRPFTTQKLCAGHRDSVIVGAKKNHKNKKPDTHSFVPKQEEATEFFPEAMLLKEAGVRRGRRNNGGLAYVGDCGSGDGTVEPDGDGEERLRESKRVIGQDLFNVLRKSWGANLESFIFERVTPIAGDISDENFGIKDSILREEMWNEIDIVLNSAATTNFDERYDIASGINTYGALHVLNFAKKCIKLKVLVHASTGQCRLELCPYTLISYFDCP
nr:isoform 2 of probable fatty acyl-coa reductase 4 [Quercus suber]